MGLVLLGSGTVLQAVYTNYLNYLGDEVSFSTYRTSQCHDLRAIQHCCCYDCRLSILVQFCHAHNRWMAMMTKLQAALLDTFSVFRISIKRLLKHVTPWQVNLPLLLLVAGLLTSLLAWLGCWGSIRCVKGTRIL